MASICLSADEAFAAGYEDGAKDEPLSTREISQLVALHAPHLRPREECHDGSATTVAG